MSKPIVSRSGAPIAELIDDSTRQQLEGLRDRLAKSESTQRPRGADGRFSGVPQDQLVRDNKTLQRFKDITAAVGDRSVGWLLDAAQVPSVTQLTKRYSTQASRAPLLGLLAGRHLGPVQATLLGTSSKLGTGGALVPYQARPNVPLDVSTPPSLWDGLKAFGRSVMDQATQVWDKLKNHRLVAPVLAFFVGKGFTAAHAAVHGANPPKDPTPGAPLQATLSLPAPPRRLALTHTPKADLSQDLAKLGDMPEPNAVSALLERSDALTGKPGYGRIAGRLAEGLFSDPQVRTALQGAEGFSPRLLSQVQAATPWLSLGDLPATDPAGSDRGTRAADLVQSLALGGNKTAHLLSTVHDLEAQGLSTQLLRLIDETAQLSASQEAGRLDLKAVGSKLQARAAQGAFDPALAELMQQAASRGLLERALSA